MLRLAIISVAFGFLVACSSSDGVIAIHPQTAGAGGQGASSAGASSQPGASGGAGGGQGTAGAGGVPSAGGGAGEVGGSVSGGAAGSSGSGVGGSNASAGGVSGGGAGGASSAHPSGPSAGCGKDFPDPFKVAVQHDLTVNVAAQYRPAYVSRKYYTQLPPSYDGKKPFPVVFYGQGCGQNGPEDSGFYPSDNYIIAQMIPAVVTTSTVVPANGPPGCFQAGKLGLADSPDGPYFDQALAQIEENYCIDKGKVFSGGWSSGAWLSTFLACSRGNVVRGVATVAGGLQHDHGTCTGGAAVMMIIGNTDNENGIVDTVGGFDVGTGQARDIFVKANGCSATSVGWYAAYPTCQIYGGCDSPVIWCPVDGTHGAGLDIQAASAWKFWTSLK